MKQRVVRNRRIGAALRKHRQTAAEQAVATYQSRLFYAVLLIFSIIFGGTAGYHVIEQWPLIDALYMTVITLTTVGFGETHSLSDNGRIFTMVLILFSVGTTGYAVSTIAAFIVEGQLNHFLRGRRMERTIAR